MKLSRCAVGIDLGSNTLRMVAMRCIDKQIIYRDEAIVRTAEGIVKDGNIAQNTIETIIKTLEQMLHHIDTSQCILRAVTTEAMRRAFNQQVALQKIYEACGVKFEVIDALKEAHLTAKALRFRLQNLGYSNKRFVSVDIGGGSTEVSFVDGDRITTQSFPIGIVTVATRFQTKDRIVAATKELFLPVKDFVQKYYSLHPKSDLFVATAGTPTTVAAIKHHLSYDTYDPDTVNGTEIRQDELDLYLHQLLHMSEKERASMVGVGREDLIVAGVILFQACFETLGIDRCIVIDDGLREGVALGLCQRED